MASTNSQPSVPVIVLKQTRGAAIDIVRLLPAILGSVIFHVLLLGVLFLVAPVSSASPPTEVKEENTVNADPAEEKKNSDPFLTTDIDPAAQETDTDINYNVERKADMSVPGMVNPNEAPGIVDAPKDAPPVNLPAPGGFGAKGQGGTMESDIGNSLATGMVGGYGPRGMPLGGSFYGRSGTTRDIALRDGGGTKESEAAVTRGLQWLARHQLSEGNWKLDDPRFKDRGSNNDIAATAFGLLPLLGAGKHHKMTKDNPYDKPIEKALLYLIRKQNKKTGDFGGGMYSHGLATIAISEAYGLSQDPNLRRPAQLAVNFIVSAQHDAGGWRYSPGQAGDTSVVGWQVMALKSAQMAALDVPEVTMRKAIRYLESCCSAGDAGDEGYGYVGVGSTPTMSSVGLLCRQYLQAWGDKNPRMIKGVKYHILTNPPNAKNMYYSYYATQVMHHFGGQEWKKWNEKMREDLMATQDKGKDAMSGSWPSAGDPHGPSGGRLMQTSLSLLTLEVYYRHLPLYYRDTGEKKVTPN